MEQGEQMVGKVCLVTGATSGIGEVTARGLAARGATVVVGGRNAQKGAATVQRIRAETGNPDVHFLQADLSVQAEVRQLAGAFGARYDRLDVLVNNAGALFATRQESADGLEMTFALNHLGYFLLTYLLLAPLIASAPARVVVVSSDAHRGARLFWDDLQLTRGYHMWRAYQQSKLANVLFAYELARRLAGTGVTVNALHPGFVATNFGKNNGMIGRLLMPLLHLVAISPEQGAETPLYLASSPDVAGVTGRYFARKRPVRSTPASYDEAAARRLWEVSAALTGVAPLTP